MAKRKATTPGTDKLTFEESLEELESIVEAMEEGEVPLADALAKYERGVTLIKRCRLLLDEAEKKIELLTEDGKGNPVTDALDVEDEEQ